MTKVFKSLTVLLLLALMLPIAVLLASSLFVNEGFEAGIGKLGTQNFGLAWEFLGSSKIFKDSFLFAFLSSAAATLYGLIIAWFCRRTDIRYGRALLLLSLLPMFVPGVIYTYAWIILASPEIGMLNGLLGFIESGNATFNIYSFAGMIWVESLRGAPMVLLIVGAMLTSLDPKQEYSARLCGASNWQVFTRITIPLLAPALGASFLLLFIRALGTFEVPAMLGSPIGVEVFAYSLYESYLNYPLSTGPVAAASVPLVVLAIALVYSHELLVKKRSHQLSTAFSQGLDMKLSLGNSRNWISFILLLVVGALALLPILAVAWSSLHPYFVLPSIESLSNVSLDAYEQVFSSERVKAAAISTLKVSTVAATLIVTISIVFAWTLERINTKTNKYIEPVIDTLLAIPGIVIGLAILIFHTKFDTGLYGTSMLVILAFVSKFAPQGLRFVRSGLNQIPVDLEHSARCSGASDWRVLTSITLPLLVPAMAACWLYVLILCSKDLSTALLLYVPGKEVLSVVLWQYWESGDVKEMSALSVLLLVPVFVLAGLFQLTKRGLNNIRA